MSIVNEGYLGDDKSIITLDQKENDFKIPLDYPYATKKIQNSTYSGSYGNLPSYDSELLAKGLYEIWQKLLAFLRKPLTPVFVVIQKPEDRDCILDWASNGHKQNREIVAIGRTKSGHLFMVNKPSVGDT